MDFSNISLTTVVSHVTVGHGGPSGGHVHGHGSHGVHHAADDLENISPVTLSSDWSRVARLLLLVSLAIVGSVGNVFMISAVMIEDHLKKRGKFFNINLVFIYYKIILQLVILK